MISLAANLQSISLPLDQLYLDPNNPRFVGSDWIFIPDELAVEKLAQIEAADRLIKHHEVDKLQMVMEANGYLPIDRVVVRRISDEKYLVLEGNRRICAAKQITGFSGDGSPLPAEIKETFKIIPCLEYVGQDDGGQAAWIFQGLRHITGVSEWPAFNKAKLIVDEMEKNDLSFTEVGKRFGLSPYGAAQWVRGYFAFKQAKDETEYGRFIDERVYPYFQEIFGRSSIALKEWLVWEEQQSKFLSQPNLNEFVGWFFPVEKAENGDEEEVDREPTTAEAAAAWDRRWISKRDDLRKASYLITKAPKEWLEFRQGLELETAYSRAVLNELEHKFASDQDAAEKLFKYVDETSKLIEETPFSVLGKQEIRAKLFSKLDKIAEIYARLKNLTNG